VDQDFQVLKPVYLPGKKTVEIVPDRYLTLKKRTGSGKGKGYGCYE